jgi:hypothetical protein
MWRQQQTVCLRVRLIDCLVLGIRIINLNMIYRVISKGGFRRGFRRGFRPPTTIVPVAVLGGGARWRC